MFLATTFLKNVASPWSSIGSHSSSMSLTAWHSPLRRWDCEWGGGETWEDLSSPESLALDIPDPGEDGVEHEGHAMGIPRFLYFEGKFAWAWFPELPNPKLLLQQLQVCGRHYNKLSSDKVGSEKLSFYSAFSLSQRQSAFIRNLVCLRWAQRSSDFIIYYYLFYYLFSLS